MHSAFASPQTITLILRRMSDAVGHASKDHPGSTGLTGLRASRPAFSGRLSMRDVGWAPRETCLPPRSAPPAFLIRTHNSFPVQRRRRHALRPAFGARCRLAKHEDAAAVEL